MVKKKSNKVKFICITLLTLGFFYNFYKENSNFDEVDSTEIRIIMPEDELSINNTSWEHSTYDSLKFNINNNDILLEGLDQKFSGQIIKSYAEEHKKLFEYENLILNIYQLESNSVKYILFFMTFTDINNKESSFIKIIPGTIDEKEFPDLKDEFLLSFKENVSKENYYYKTI
ncbi:MAG: hypothetical protein R3Y13_05560 [bacterium]